tara:strand:+ start:391 stop:1737 length:1347 start_codon:yes stop_codon:yes gene_type:complete
MINYLNSILTDIKVKKNSLFFCSFIVLFVASLAIVKADLVGSLSLIFIALITFYFSRYYKSLATILYVALCVRLVTIFFGNFLVILPDSWGDATLFELRAWEYSQDGFFGVLSNFPSDKSSLYISWILAFFYSLTDRSIIMGQSLSLLFGMGSVLLGSRLAHKIWSEKISIKVGWILALYPTLVLYSCLILREAYVWFFLLVALYGVVCWSKGGGFKAIIIIFIGFSGATFFHGGMFMGMFIFLAILIIINFIKTLKSLSCSKISINSLTVLSFLIIINIYLVSISESIPKIGSLKDTFNIEQLLIEISNRNINTAGFPTWTIPKTEFELIYKAPIRVLYFLFSPFLWDIKKITHLFGFFDGMFHIMLFILFIKNFKLIWSDRTLRIILIILASYLIFYGLATGNFGTGLRHRTKFIIVSILMVAPWIPQLVFFDKKQRNINNKKFGL